MFNKHHNTTKKDGVILLLVVVILTAIFSISIGIFGVIINQVSTSGTFENSNIALYAADQSIERTLYRDRTPQENDFPCAAAASPCTTVAAPMPLASGGCMNVTIVKTVSPNTAQITATGLSNACNTVTERTVVRAFLTTY